MRTAKYLSTKRYIKHPSMTFKVLAAGVASELNVWQNNLAICS